MTKAFHEPAFWVVGTFLFIWMVWVWPWLWKKMDPKPVQVPTPTPHAPESYTGSTLGSETVRIGIGDAYGGVTLLGVDSGDYWIRTADGSYIHSIVLREADSCIVTYTTNAGTTRRALVYPVPDHNAIVWSPA